MRSPRDGRNVRYAFLYELLGMFGDFPFRFLIGMVAPSASDRKISRTRLRCLLSPDQPSRILATRQSSVAPPYYVLRHGPPRSRAAWATARTSRIPLIAWEASSRPSHQNLYSSETTFLARGMDGALMLSSVTPNSTSFGIRQGSPAASPQTPTQMSAPRAASQVSPMSFSTAG